jgi:calcineurin-like phosphoesterase family protein
MMHEVFIENWNSVVPTDGSVYILGDLSFHRPDKTAAILKQMHGKKFLVPGNHDKKKVKHYLNMPNIITVLPPLTEVKVSDGDAFQKQQLIVLCHYAMLKWNKSHHGSWQLFGHSHGGLPDTGMRSCDVGVDAWSYTPVSYKQIKQLIGDKPVLKGGD